MWISAMRQYYWMFIFLLAPGANANEPVSVGFLNNVAVGGHDVTAYYQLDKGQTAIKGDKTFVVQYKGAQWHFLTEADRKAFAKNPEKFAPAYNGHCANALSLGEGLIPTNGKYWAIFDDQLYLFFAPRGARRWLAADDYREYKADADRAWQAILSER